MLSARALALAGASPRALAALSLREHQPSLVRQRTPIDPRALSIPFQERKRERERDIGHTWRARHNLPLYVVGYTYRYERKRRAESSRGDACKLYSGEVVSYATISCVGERERERESCTFCVYTTVHPCKCRQVVRVNVRSDMNAHVIYARSETE